MITFCISTYNNLKYLEIAVKSVRKNSYYKDAPFIIHAENCTDGTDEWLRAMADIYNLTYYIDKNEVPLGIGGGMNFCAEKVDTEFIMFLHSDFYVTKNWDKALMDVFEKYPTRKMWGNSHRVEPNMFNNPDQRPGTVIVPKDMFGAYYNDFDKELFEGWAQEFTQTNDFEIPKGEGVSGLIRKKDWDEIGGNDPLFAPASWDDMDLFLRMHRSRYYFVLTSKSMVFHFGARGSHRLEENNNQTSARQLKAEADNYKKWLGKYGSIPRKNEFEMICGLADDYKQTQVRTTSLKDIAKSCDAIVLPAFIADEDDIERIEFLQKKNKNFNPLFNKTIICVNYKSLEIRKQLMEKTEEVFNKYFNNVEFIHNKTNYENVRSLCEQEEALIQLCKKYNYKRVCKTMDHMVIFNEALKLQLDPNADFHYTNGVGYARCRDKGFKIQEIYENTYFPQTNFYFIDVSKIDFIYDIKEVERRHLEWENDNSVCPNGYFVCCEEETGIMGIRNNLVKQDMIPPSVFRLLISNVIKQDIHDPSFKNLITCGICHLQYHKQKYYVLI